MGKSLTEYATVCLLIQRISSVETVRNARQSLHSANSSITINLPGRTVISLILVMQTQFVICGEEKRLCLLLR